MTFLSTLLDTPDYLLHLIFKEDATFTELLYIALAFALLWGIIFVSARIILIHLTYGKPWLYAACERHYNCGGREEGEALGFLDKDMSKQDAVSKMMKDWPFLQVIVLQHLAGALFCVPSLLGVGDEKWANSLAACGVLSEVGKYVVVIAFMSHLNMLFCLQVYSRCRFSVMQDGKLKAYLSLDTFGK